MAKRGMSVTARFLGSAMFLVAAAIGAGAQTCTTQAKMVPAVYNGLGDAALAIATAIKSDDTATVQRLSVVELSNNFAATAYLVRTTGEAVANDTLAVTQRYELDANALAPGAGSADFTCNLSGSASEVDFSIGGLGKGMYGFVMVEARGDRPWLLSMLLRQDGGVWKMAGLYPHARSAAGHDGVWYWTEARNKAAGSLSWQTWLAYGTAETLLAPTGFMTSTSLEKLRTERSAAAPAQLRDGLSADTPLAVKSSDGRTFSITSLSVDGSEDGKRLNLVLHYKADSAADPAAARARNLAAVQALIAAFPELKGAYDGALVTADTGSQPFTTLFTKADF